MVIKNDRIEIKPVYIQLEKIELYLKKYRIMQRLTYHSKA